MEFIDTKKLEELQSNNTKMLVDITASWCGPCKTLVPRLEKIESDYPDIKFVKLNADTNRDYLINSGISSVPTVMFFDGNKLISRSTGVQLESFYREILKNM
jgi:thioredoxin 1